MFRNNYSQTDNYPHISPFKSHVKRVQTSQQHFPVVTTVPSGNLSIPRVNTGTQTIALFWLRNVWHSEILEDRRVNTLTRLSKDRMSYKVCLSECAQNACGQEGRGNVCRWLLHMGPKHIDNSRRTHRKEWMCDCVVLITDATWNVKSSCFTCWCYGTCEEWVGPGTWETPSVEILYLWPRTHNCRTGNPPDTQAQNTSESH